MKRLKLFLVTTIAIMCTTTVLAQTPNKKQRISREQMVEIQAKHIAEDLALDDKTNKKFIDTYSRYKKEIWTIAPKPGKKMNKPSETEEQAAQKMRERFERSQKILDIRDKYYKEFSKFMTQKQIEMMYEKEKKIMQRLKMRHDGKRGMPKRNGNKQ